jgi:glycosyltransferase involved in cell wall biosynthesis
MYPMPDPFERTPIAQAPLSVVLLASGDSGGFEDVVANWIAQLETLGRDYEIFAEMDGNVDHTQDSATDLESKYPRFRLLPHPGQPGVGAALRTGLGAAQFPLLCYAECSNAYHPEDLGRLLEAIDKVDVVSGYRSGQSARRRPLSRFGYRMLLRLLFGLRLVDVDCPFKLFRRSIFARIPIQSNGPFVHAEILAKANFLGSIVTEVPVRYEPANQSRTEPLVSAWRGDASRVFLHPDFGPPVLPEQPSPQSAEANLP